MLFHTGVKHLDDKENAMRRTLGLLLLFGLMCGVWSVAAAQQQSGVQAPPKVMVVAREFVKPGKSGLSHEKTESAFVQAMMKANWPVHYVAMDSMSGKNRSLFFIGYDSFDAWGKDMLATEKNTVLASALDQAGVADGNLLDATDQSVLVFDEDMSLRPAVDIAHMRYMEIEVFHVKAGHNHDWVEAVKIVKDAYEKSVPDAHWAMYRLVYGGQGGTYVVFTPMKSVGDVDEMMADSKKFAAALGEDGMKKLSELEGAGFDSPEINLFTFNPRMSYAPPEWIKANPDFWKPKTMMASAPAAKKTTASVKPAAAQ
jgi:hypothetical protein